MTRFWGRASAMALLVCGSCTYGAEEQRYEIASVTVDPTSELVGILVIHSVRRDPTGLSTFPDGGSPKVRYTEATLFFGDLTAATVREVERLPAPVNASRRFAAVFLGWNRDTVYFDLRRCVDGSSCSETNRTIYRATALGEVTVVPVVPVGLSKQTGAAFWAGDSVYIKLPNDNVPRFVLDKSGVVTALTRSRDSSHVITGVWSAESATLEATWGGAVFRGRCHGVIIWQRITFDAQGSFRLPGVRDRILLTSGSPTGVIDTIMVSGLITATSTPRTLRIILPAYSGIPGVTDTFHLLEGKPAGARPCP